jgi:hypothetical protein
VKFLFAASTECTGQLTRRMTFGGVSIPRQQQLNAHVDSDRVLRAVAALGHEVLERTGFGGASGHTRCSARSTRDPTKGLPGLPWTRQYTSPCKPLSCKTEACRMRSLIKTKKTASLALVNIIRGKDTITNPEPYCPSVGVRKALVSFVQRYWSRIVSPDPKHCSICCGLPGGTWVGAKAVALLCTLLYHRCDNPTIIRPCQLRCPSASQQSCSKTTRRSL